MRLVELKEVRVRPPRNTEAGHKAAETTWRRRGWTVRGWTLGCKAGLPPRGRSMLDWLDPRKSSVLHLGRVAKNLILE